MSPSVQKINTHTVLFEAHRLLLDTYFEIKTTKQLASLDTNHHINEGYDKGYRRECFGL